MDRRPPNRHTDEDADPDMPEGTPRWVRTFGIVALVVLVLVVILVFAGAHDPSRFVH